MDDLEKKSRVKALWQALSRCDLDAIMAVTHHDAIFEFSDGVAVTASDMTNYMSFYQDFYDMAFLEPNIVVDGDRAAAEVVLAVTYTKDRPGFPPARGQTVDVPFGVFCSFDDNKFAKVGLIYSIADWMRLFEASVPNLEVVS